MMVTFISQCEKKALPRTRRVLDAFANRIGSNTWQTVITQEGLLAVKKLLRKTASKNTAVSCHWIRSRARSDLLWIVGNKRKFNELGYVPVNVTSDDKRPNERFAINKDVIALLSSLAGFFHDIGKANALFQQKLRRRSEKSYECYRHEWVSLRLFQAFVNGRNDREWLESLGNIDNAAEQLLLQSLSPLKDGIAQTSPDSLSQLGPIAKFVAWLIVSHHKLPTYPRKIDNKPDLTKINQWHDTIFEAIWNSPQAINQDWTNAELEKNWDFPFGTPFASAQWQTHVSIIAKKILRCERVFLSEWLHQRHTAHLSRLALMLADHYYSSNDPTVKITREWQDRNYAAYANTYTDSEGVSKLKQKLDEHNIAVGIHAEKIAKQLPNLREELPVLTSNSLAQHTTIKDFIWQNKAYDLAKQIKDESRNNGFFGICMASTGKGKTLGNARIMYGLSGEKNCRFNIALGLRALTLQTADALKKDLKLTSEQITTLIGSQVVKELHANQFDKTLSLQETQGSESSEPLVKDDIQVLGGADDYIGDFDEWIKHDPKIKRLIHAPLLISTIDYLIPASDGTRGGRQIAPMLRLLTSDLVLDEPDDFGLDDLPALCRIVNWAGMLGSRVLLSTATMPPSLASALFSAYQAGRKHYTEVNGEQGANDVICCAWFDEFKQPKSAQISNKQEFDDTHKRFVDSRIDNLKKSSQALRKAKLVNIAPKVEKTTKPSESMANHISQSIAQLHDQHAVDLQDKKVSIGLVRLANINPLVQIAKYLLNTKPMPNTIIHYCVYHSQFPLIQRSKIERQLDAALNRKDHDNWLEKSNIIEKLQTYAETNQIFVVLATSVAEVGRDHDYDWAVVEPSSMRSIIQLAGRVQRHRKVEPVSENIHILSTNYKGLQNTHPNYIRPGFETKRIQLASSSLFKLHVEEHIQNISATPRIQTIDGSSVLLTPDQPPKIKSFNALEHLSQQMTLFGSQTKESAASLWWETDATWNGELQARQPFRKSTSNVEFEYCLFQPPHGNKIRWHEKIPKTYPSKYQVTEAISQNSEDVLMAERVTFWIDTDISSEIESWTKRYGGNTETTMKKLTHIALTRHNANSSEQWQWHPNLGVFKKLKQDRWNNDSHRRKTSKFN